MQWSPNVRIPNQTSKAAPALAGLPNQLHLLHLGNSSNNIWHSIWNGTRWSTNVRIPNQTSKATPAMTTRFDLGLLMLHLGNSSNSIWSTVFDGTKWSPNVRTFLESDKAPALLGQTAVFVEPGSTRLFGADFNGAGDFFEPELISGQTTKASPALGLFDSAGGDGGGMHLVHLGQTSNNLWHSRRTG